MGFDLICYLNFAYPTIEDGLENVKKYYDCGCRTIQLDLPSKDPYLEQQMIKDRMAYCLKNNPDYDTYLEAIHKVHETYKDLKIYLMLYADIVDSIGLEKLIKFCKENDIKDASALGADEKMLKAFEDAGFTKSTYVEQHVPDHELEAAKKADVIMYQVRPLPNQEKRDGIDGFESGVKYLRDKGLNKSIYATVGVKTPEDIVMIKHAGADGAFIGSVLMKVIDDQEKLKEVLTEFVDATKR